MSASPAAEISPDRALRRLFLTLFLRGRSSRGLRRATTPTSVGSKLAGTLAIYALIGLIAFTFRRGPVFTLALYLHGMTLVFLGMFVAGSAGEVLFNKEEGDILLHRPVTSRSVLRAKVGVLVEVSLWLAGAFNLVGLYVGLGTKDGTVLFPVVHLISTALEALFCTGSVVLTYELCLRWFGRERLDGLMTGVQVVVAIAAVAGGQIVPQLIRRFGTGMSFNLDFWWIGLLPPAWFAGFDSALAGHGQRSEWLLAAMGLAATAAVLWLAFWKLAHHYESGVQILGEVSAPRPERNRRRSWLAAMVEAPPLRWWLREPVTRASFLLVAHYLVRDRDVKLRIYPGLAPMLVMPLIFLLQDTHHDGFGGGFGVAFCGGYLGLVPLIAVNLMQYSQQWQAADVFRAAPIPGPAPLCTGARWAVQCFLTLPIVLGVALLISCLGGPAQLPLLLPGLIALPLYALYANLGGKAVPLSVASESAKSAGRSLVMMAVMFISMALSGLATWAWITGYFRRFLLMEAVAAVIIYALMHRSDVASRWPVEE